MEESSEIIIELLSRFKTQPRWIQHLAVHVGDNNSLDETTIQQLKIQCINESNGLDIEGPSDVDLIKAFGIQQESVTSLHLNKLSNPIGINKLNPITSLDFGGYSLTVIYGPNGAGKSGFVRILKIISDHSDTDTILPNVFTASPEVQKCDINYSIDGLEKEVEWIIDKKDNMDLKSIDIYDNSTGNEYLKGIKNVTYESPFLRIFDSVIDGIGLVKAGIEADLNRLIQQVILPHRSNELSSTASFKWLNGLNKDISLDEIELRCTWNETDEKSLKKLQKRYDQKSPADKAKNIRKRIKHLNEILRSSTEYYHELSDETYKEINEIRIQKDIADNLAKKDADRIFKGRFDGIGTIAWSQMWESAKKYSENYAYKGEDFPNTKDSAKCVLCQQELNDDGKRNLNDFKDYVVGELKRKVEELNENLRKKEALIPLIPDSEAIKIKLEAGGIDDEKIIESITNCYDSLRIRASKILDKKSTEELGKETRLNWRGYIKRAIKQYEEEAKLFEVDSQNESKDEIKQQIDELNARKWLNENFENIALYKEHLIRRSNLEKAAINANKRSCSRIKKALSDLYLSQDYIFRFNQELDLLGADRIKVKAIPHIKDTSLSLEIALENTTYSNLNDVLSDGEKRIISIAAFLSDVRSKKQNTPFIFDDPITSLDDDYERDTVKRLVRLSRERQVIVFTHRLSMVSHFYRELKKKANFIGITSIGGESGLKRSIPVPVENPNTTLNVILNTNIRTARTMINEGKIDGYLVYQQGIINEMRKSIESTIEIILLNDIIGRYRQNIMTNGKLDQLAKIRIEDCTLLDNLMEKYSIDLHLQSIEIPKEVYEPDEVEKDVIKLRDWIQDFKGRQ